MAAKPQIRQETDEWHEWYGDPVEIERRRQNMPAKLERFGLKEAPRDAIVLDMCCGHGEAMETLRDWGFTRVEGFDQRIHQSLKASPHFKTHEGDAQVSGLPPTTMIGFSTSIRCTTWATSPELSVWIEEMRRILRPGGRFAIVDFYGSPQLTLAFWLFRQDWFHMTRYLRHFGKQVQDEWEFLGPYARNWPRIKPLLWNNGFEVERVSHDPWYFYLTLRKPAR